MLLKKYCKNEVFISLFVQQKGMCFKVIPICALAYFDVAGFLVFVCAEPSKNKESFITALNNMEYEKALSYVDES